MFIGKWGFEMNTNKKIEAIKERKVNMNTKDIINFLIETKAEIKSYSILDMELKVLYSKVEEIYEKAMENIKDEKDLKRITSKYEEIKRVKKLKNYSIVLILNFFIVSLILILFLTSDMPLIGISISLLLSCIISLAYFNIDLSNIKKGKSIFDFKDTEENEICILLCFILISVLIILFAVHFSIKDQEKTAYRDYYDDKVEKYDVEIEFVFKDNLIFNQCDITFKLYDKEEYFKHGEDKNITVKLPKGIHTLEFSGNDDTEKEKLEIDGNKKVKYKMECNSNGIYVFKE